MFSAFRHFALLSRSSPENISRIWASGLTCGGLLKTRSTAKRASISAHAQDVASEMEPIGQRTAHCTVTGFDGAVPAAASQTRITRLVALVVGSSSALSHSRHLLPRCDGGHSPSSLCIRVRGTPLNCSGAAAIHSAIPRRFRPRVPLQSSQLGCDSARCSMEQFASAAVHSPPTVGADQRVYQSRTSS